MYSIQCLRGVRMAIVLVERRQLSPSLAGTLIFELQGKFALPVMLVAKDESSWHQVKAAAEFDTAPYLYALLANSDIDWSELEPAELELPF